MRYADESAHFSSKPDSFLHDKNRPKAAPGLAGSSYDTLDEIDTLSVQARRGLDCARRGGEAGGEAWTGLGPSDQRGDGRRDLGRLE